MTNGIKGTERREMREVKGERLLMAGLRSRVTSHVFQLRSHVSPISSPNSPSHFLKSFMSSFSGSSGCNIFTSQIKTFIIKPFFMNKNTFTSPSMKKTVVTVSPTLVSISLLLSSFSAHKMTDDMWKMLGITKQTGDEKIKNSFINGYLYYYGVKNLKNISVNDREALAKDLLTYTKQFVSSAIFTKEYEDMRKSARPQEEPLKHLRSIEEI